MAAGYDEVSDFLQKPLLKRCDDPAIWWKHNKIRYPALSNVAQIYLAPPTTSIPSERLFSGVTVYSCVFHCWLHSYARWCSLGLQLKNIRLQPRPDLQSQIRPRRDLKKIKSGATLQGIPFQRTDAATLNERWSTVGRQNDGIVQ